MKAKCIRKLLTPMILVMKVGLTILLATLTGQAIDVPAILDDLGCRITCPYVTAVSDLFDTPTVRVVNNLNLPAYLRAPSRPATDNPMCPVGLLPLDVTAGLLPAATCRDGLNSPPVGGPRTMTSKVYKGMVGFPGSVNNEAGVEVYAPQGQPVIELIHKIAAEATSLVDVASLTVYAGRYKEVLARGIARNVFRRRTAGSCATGFTVNPGLIVRFTFTDWDWPSLGLDFTAQFSTPGVRIKDFAETLKMDINNFYRLLVIARCDDEGVEIGGPIPRATEAITFAAMNLNWTNGWNHSKIITNGLESMVGGQNMWNVDDLALKPEGDYIATTSTTTTPVEDISFHIRNQGISGVGDNASAGLVSTIDSIWRTYQGEEFPMPRPPLYYTTSRPWYDDSTPACSLPDPCVVTDGRFYNLSARFDWGSSVETFMRRRDQVQFHYTWLVRSYGSPVNPAYMLGQLGLLVLYPYDALIAGIPIDVIIEGIDLFTNAEISGGDRVHASIIDRLEEGQTLYIAQQDLWFARLLAEPPVSTAGVGTTVPVLALIDRIARLGHRALHGTSWGPSGPIQILKSSSNLAQGSYTNMTAAAVDEVLLARAYAVYRARAADPVAAPVFTAAVRAAGYQVRAFRYSGRATDYGRLDMAGVWTDGALPADGDRLHGKFVMGGYDIVSIGSDNFYDTGNTEVSVISRDGRFLNPALSWFAAAWANSRPVAP